MDLTSIAAGAGSTLVAAGALFAAFNTRKKDSADAGAVTIQTLIASLAKRIDQQDAELRSCEEGRKADRLDCDAREKRLRHDMAGLGQKLDGVIYLARKAGVNIDPAELRRVSEQKPLDLQQLGVEP